jgi:hypothetical protein
LLVAFVDGDVVSPAQEHQIRHVGGAAVLPFDEMVHVAPASRGTTATVLAVAVAHRDRAALGRARGAGAAPEVEDLAALVELHPAELQSHSSRSIVDRPTGPNPRSSLRQS